MSVLDAITSNSFGDFSPCPWISPLHCKCWFVMQPKVLGWAFVDLFISLSPALYSVLVSLVSSRHLGLLGLPAPFPQLGETTCSACVSPSCSMTWKLSRGSKLGTPAARLFLSSRDHCLLLLVQYLQCCCFIHFIRFLLFHTRRLNLVPLFMLSWPEVISLWFQFTFSWELVILSTF